MYGPAVRSKKISTSGRTDQHADAPHALALLRSRHDRPHHRRAADQRDEPAPFHSITSSARSKNVSGIARPSALTVVRLMTKLELGRLLDRKVSGFTPFENFVDKVDRMSELVRVVGP
jgi:hypothetical protein